MTKISQRKMAEALDITHQAVAAAARKGMPLTSIEEARAWREARFVEPPAKQRGAALEEAYRHAKMRRETAEAELAELKLAEQHGKVIRIEAVRAGLASIISSTRESLLQIPARLATIIAVESDPGKVHDLLQKELNYALSRLAASPDRI